MYYYLEYRFNYINFNDIDALELENCTVAALTLVSVKETTLKLKK
jgi:hypothetical protein